MVKIYPCPSQEIESQLKSISDQPKNDEKQYYQTNSQQSLPNTNEQTIKSSTLTSDQHLQENQSQIGKENQINSCYLCLEAQTENDPYIFHCQCSSSNTIHSSCLIQIVVNNIKKQQEKQIINSTKDKEQFNQECSICKYEYSAQLIYKRKPHFRINYNNLYEIIIFLCTFLIASGSCIFGYQLTNEINKQSNENKNLEFYYKVLYGFVICFCILIGSLSLIVALKFLKAAFTKRQYSNLKIVSSNNKEICYKYDPKNDQFVYLFLVQQQIQVSN